MTYSRFSGDALISRSRSRVLGNFYYQKHSDVLVMVDHDIEWRPGDLCHIAEQAFEQNALVGGLYCKRAFKRGWASTLKAEGAVRFGEAPGQLLQTPSLATGFLAIPYKAIEAIVENLYIDSPAYLARMEELHKDGRIGEMLLLHDLSISKIQDGAWQTPEFDYFDFFRCFRLPTNNPDKPTYCQFLSEDWSFSHRALYCGIKSYISTLPVITHHGHHGYTVADGMDDTLLKAAQEHGENNNPTNTKNKDKRARRVKRGVRNK